MNRPPCPLCGSVEEQCDHLVRPQASPEEMLAEGADDGPRLADLLDRRATARERLETVQEAELNLLSLLAEPLGHIISDPDPHPVFLGILRSTVAAAAEAGRVVAMADEARDRIERLCEEQT